MRKLQFRDTFAIARILAKTNVEKDLMDVYTQGNKEKLNDKEMGIKVLFVITKTAAEAGIEEEVYNFLGGVFEMPPEEVQCMEFSTLAELIKRFASENDLIGFFKSVRAVTK